MTVFKVKSKEASHRYMGAGEVFFITQDDEVVDLVYTERQNHFPLRNFTYTDTRAMGDEDWSMFVNSVLDDWKEAGHEVKTGMAGSYEVTEI